MISLIKHVVSWCLVSLLLASCGGGESNTTSASTNPANFTATPNPGFGKAQLEAGLANATIELQDLDGRRPRSLERTTRGNGTFVVSMPQSQAKAFRLVFKGGTHAGAAFGDELVVDVDPYDANRDLLYANAVTTLVARYRDRHPEQSVADAAARVKRFLDIPEASSVGFDVSNPKQTYFDHAQLLAQARSASIPLGTYLGGLVDEMDRGVTQHTFTAVAISVDKENINKNLKITFDQENIKKYLKLAAKGLLEHLGDELFAWGFEAILTSLGIGGNAELLEQLHEINAKLDELTNLVNEVLVEQKQTDVEIVSNTLLGAISDIKAQYRNLTWANEHFQLACLVNAVTNEPIDQKCAQDRQAVQNTVRQNIKAILDPNVGIIHDVELLRTALVTSGGESGVILRWNDYLKSTSPFYSSKTNPKLIAIGTFYESVQLTATDLIVEAYMAQDPPDRASAKYYVQLNEKAVAEQEKLIAEQHALVPPHDDDFVTMLDLRTKLTWQQTPISHFQAENQYQYLTQATLTCDHMRERSLGGYKNWRLPTDPELHEVVKGSPNPTGNADGGSGIFAWLRDNGFGFTTDEKTRPVNGFLIGTAYYSSTISGVTGDYHEALFDSGVNYMDRSNIEGNRAGVWCVTDESKSSGEGK